jgi:hypothetical protein
MKVRVYFNLHKNLLSVQSKGKNGWRVIAHEESVALRDVKFKVSEAGRQRVLKEKKKNVHAFIEGAIVKGNERISADTPVSYNPFRGPFFQSEKGDIHSSHSVIIFGKKVFASI